MGRTELFDLERHFAFYGAYHSNSVNILIHTLFVWPIFFTSLVLLAVLGFPVVEGCDCCVGFRVLEEAVTSNGRATWMNSAFLSIKRCTSLVHVLASDGLLVFLIQKRAPALWDNLVQAFLMGPFFVLLECLRTLSRVSCNASAEQKIEAQIKEWQDKKQKKIT